MHPQSADETITLRKRGGGRVACLGRLIWPFGSYKNTNKEKSWTITKRYLRENVIFLGYEKLTKAMSRPKLETRFPTPDHVDWLSSPILHGSHATTS